MTAALNLTGEQIRELVRRVQAGEDRGDVAVRLGVHRSTIDKQMQAAGVHRKTGPRQPRSPHRGPDPSWMAQGNCRSLPAFVDWPPDAQIAVCRGRTDPAYGFGECPVLARCAQWGLEVPCLHRDDLVVFGGMAPEVRLRRQKEIRDREQRKAS